jgi:hypothetical protein
MRPYIIPRILPLSIAMERGQGVRFLYCITTSRPVPLDCSAASSTAMMCRA